MQACQESVSDPTDLLFSMKKLPILAICDDPCTLIQHIGHRFPTEAKLAYGETQGCFEKPSMTKPPTKNLPCPDILPLAHSSNVTDRSAMTKSSILLHPDAQSDRRYITGTRLQMRPSGKSHKKKTCSFHDLANAEEGVLINSMNQEALQVTRKFKTIQQDKLRGFCTSFLANFLQDYFHNRKYY